TRLRGQTFAQAVIRPEITFAPIKNAFVRLGFAKILSIKFAVPNYAILNYLSRVLRLWSANKLLTVIIAAPALLTTLAIWATDLAEATLRVLRIKNTIRQLEHVRDATHRATHPEISFVKAIRRVIWNAIVNPSIIWTQSAKFAVR
uniref:Reverse transcriptase n=1 Tax=Romanomermis culicivorax TaxID=13658 RepID=A0A915L732_ROMCU